MIASSLAWLTEQSRAIFAAVSPAAHAIASLDGTAIALWTGVAVVLLLPGAACVWMARRLGRIRYVPTERIEQVEQRISQLSAALSLLTDTTEAAFRDVMQEVERQTQASHHESPFERRVSAQRRIGLAASNGRSAREIALSEGVSEGEVRLRLRLAQHLEAVTARAAMGNHPAKVCADGYSTS